MMRRGKPTEAAERARLRREREDLAQRLGAEVPTLRTLEIAIEDFRRGMDTASLRHVRRWIVPTAPALFDLPCGDPACKYGGHDITQDVLRALRSRRGGFDGSHECSGSVGTAACGRTIRYSGTATYAN